MMHPAKLNNLISDLEAAKTQRKRLNLIFTWIRAGNLSKLEFNTIMNNQQVLDLIK